MLFDSLIVFFATCQGYEYLPDVTKPVTTIGRYHTIVPPINQPQDDRPVTRSNSVMVEEPISIQHNLTHDDHAISSVSEENDPGKIPVKYNIIPSYTI